MTHSETNMSLQVTSTEATTVNRFLFVFPRNCTAFTKTLFSARLFSFLISNLENFFHTSTY